MGPLQGYRIVEFAGIGPGPFCAMMLADMGAEVIRIDRKGGDALPTEKNARADVLNRGRRSIMLDLKTEGGREIALRLIARADALIEGYRPGVMERLGLGPDVCLAQNARLVYGRMTGWGQTGPMAPVAGHDINYIAISGALSAFRRAGQPPTPPVNYVGDFGGGGMLLAFGVVCALLEAAKSGKGQVVDAAMTDGSAILGAMIYGMRAQGAWLNPPGHNLLDTGTPFYDVYETADGQFMSVGSLEAKFYGEFIRLLGVDGEEAFADQRDHSRWPAMRARIAEIFKTRSRDEWTAIFEGRDACVLPVLDLFEAPDHPHNVARETFFTDDQGIVQPSPAPRFSRTATGRPGIPPKPGEQGEAILSESGLGQAEIADLFDRGAVLR